MEDIFKSAIKYGENEFGWKEHDIPAVIDFLVRKNNAIIGADVWLLTKDEKIRELYWFDFRIHDKRESDPKMN